ncbi:MAG: penicillin-binding protein [Solirubrobacteraceae bacterium]|jgi:peptidoglycan glycosyltransferase|nr:penicillin-binding protein [Solirubrobacteraceae bacterium]
MNAPIIRLFGLVVVLFTVLVVFASRWAVFDAKSLNDNALNKRGVLEAAKIDRGVIRAGDGTVLARSVKQQGGVYQRTYPTGELFSHAIGYSFTDIGQAGLERFYNDPLIGKRQGIDSLFDQLSGGRKQGDDLSVTLDPNAQRIATNALRSTGDGHGAVVAMDPHTGAIKVMASTPGYDPNNLDRPGRFAALNRDSGSPVFNRATQSSYPPGSTFKVVTAIAAIDSGRYTQDSTVSGQNGKVISGVPLQNDNGESFGAIPLTEALTNSVNTVWAEVAETLGKSTMGRYMTRLGFYSKPPLDYPADQRLASGEYRNGRLLSPLSPSIDVGRMGIGQDLLAVTPLQMAMVASAVANNGVLVRPHMGSRVVDPDGRVRDDIRPQEEGRVMRPSTAKTVGSMMSQVVKEGTGTAAALSGIEVAGKTGTAEKNQCSGNQTWFIAFAPVTNPKIAIAVTNECANGTGGEVAAPIAKQVMEALIH